MSEEMRDVVVAVGSTVVVVVVVVGIAGDCGERSNGTECSDDALAITESTMDDDVS
jgi:hypothetical protein